MVHDYEFGLFLGDGVEAREDGKRDLSAALNRAVDEGPRHKVPGDRSIRGARA